MSFGITNGNTFGSYIISASLTPVSVSAITCAEQTFTVNGLKVGDFVNVNPPSITPGVSMTCARVSAANTLALTFCNPTAGSLTPDAGSYIINVMRPERQTAAAVISD